MSEQYPLSSEEQAQLVSLLKRTVWKLPPAIFFAIVGLVPTIVIELVVITEVRNRRGKNEPRVMLFPRSLDDPFYAGMVHGPGVQIMLGETVEVALERLAKDFGGLGEVSKPLFVDYVDIQKGPLPDRNPRGQYVGLLHYAVWKGGSLPPKARLADPDDLPPNIIDFHRGFIRKAVLKYQDDKNLAD